uniref:ARAD1D04950p n=1 Tax=Blastobotrys adeninivorans TaxID=409370 RepID=A0A060T7Q7_BLAAD
MRHADMLYEHKKVAPHTNGGTSLAHRNLKLPTETSSEVSNLSFDDISFHYKYKGNWEKLAAFLERRLPVASFASLQHDVVIVIENGHKVVEEVNLLLEKLDIKGRRTIDLFGSYTILMPSGPHLAGTEFITYLNDLIGPALEPQNSTLSVILRRALVKETGDSCRVLQDGTTRSLVRLVEGYCRDQLHENSTVPSHTVHRRTPRAYVKEPDQSYQPGYQKPTAQFTNLPTAICEVGMSEVVSKVIFDCLTSFSGSKGMVDLALGVDLAVSNRGLTGIRLIVFDTSITTLSSVAEENASVARVLRSKIDYRLTHLLHLRAHLHEERSYRHYLRFAQTIDGTIDFYEGIQRHIPGINGEEVPDEDVVETCRAVLDRAQVINMTMSNGEFTVTDINGRQVSSIALKTEAFLGLVGFQDNIMLEFEILYDIYMHIANACKNDTLENTWSPIPLVLTRRHISDERYDEFVALQQGPDFDLEAFRDGQAITVERVTLGYLREDTVIRPAAKAYLGKRRIHSRALRNASALFWFREKQKERVEVYNLADLDEGEARERQRQRMWSNDYTNLVNELDIHPMFR